MVFASVQATNFPRDPRISIVSRSSPGIKATVNRAIPCVWDRCYRSFSIFEFDDDRDD